MTQTPQRDKLVYLRQWVGENIQAVTEKGVHSGKLTNIVFDGTRLMYILIDDHLCLNFDHVVEIRLEK